MERPKIKKYYLAGELIKLLGISRATLHNWEKQKKVPKPKRNKLSNYRIYTIEDIRRFKRLMGIE